MTATIKFTTNRQLERHDSIVIKKNGWVLCLSESSRKAYPPESIDSVSGDVAFE